MEKKYKLIKEYPGSPKKDFILDESWKCKYTGNHGTYTLNTMNFNPESYPDHWEEVIEKDYEILSLISTKSDKTIITYENGGGRYGENFFEHVYKLKDYWIECFTTNNNPWKIYSVKRLSDGEKFTIDDDIIEQSEHSKIEYFEVRGDDLVLRINHQVTKGSSTILISSNFKKRLTPLFTTEDGVDIFEGDKHYTIGGSKGLWEYEDKIFEHIAKIGTGQLHESNCIQGDKIYWLKFSIKEKAEKYVIMNKPCLSLNDVLNTSLTFQSSDKRHLETLVKDKLKL